MIYGIDEPDLETTDKPITVDVCEKLSENLGISVKEDDLEVVHRIGKCPVQLTASDLTDLPTSQ